MESTVKWLPWIEAACKTDNRVFLKTLGERFPELMSVIKREYLKRRIEKVQKLPPHEIVDLEGGRRVYRRKETGGSVRTLPVWTLDGEIDRMKQKQSEGKLQEYFDGLVANLTQYSAEPRDPMFFEWFSECFEISTKAYGMVVADTGIVNDTEMEFGSDLEEEFGS